MTQSHLKLRGQHGTVLTTGAANSRSYRLFALEIEIATWILSSRESIKMTTTIVEASYLGENVP